MPVQDFKKYMQLAKILNNSWGTGSQLKSGSQSIKFALKDENLLKGSVMMIVNMPNNPQTAHEFKNRYRNEAIGKMESAIKDLKGRFEDQNEGKTIRFKLLDNSITDGIEYLTNSQYRPNLHAYFRLHCLISIE